MASDLLTDHIGIYSSINNLISVDQIGTKTVQLFVSNPRGYSILDIENIKVNLKSTKIENIFVHSSYLSLPWKGSEKALDHIKDELYSCKMINASGYILHLPKDEPEVIKKGLKLVTKLNTDKQLILLEPIGVKSHETKTYETSDKINNLISVIGYDYMKKHNIGLCLDTCHLFVSGTDVTYYKQVDILLQELHHKDLIKLFHLNGSVKSLNSGKDIHAIPFDTDDQIWAHVKHTNSGLKRFIDFIVDNKIYGIIEKHDKSDDHFKKLYKKIVKLTTK